MHQNLQRGKIKRGKVETQSQKEKRNKAGWGKQTFEEQPGQITKEKRTCKKKRGVGPPQNVGLGIRGVKFLGTMKKSVRKTA